MVIPVKVYGQKRTPRSLEREEGAFGLVTQATHEPTGLGERGVLASLLDPAIPA